MAVDPFENWVAVGTSLGYHVIWDMRFQLPIRKWQHTGHGGKRTYFFNLSDSCPPACFSNAVNAENLK